MMTIEPTEDADPLTELVPFADALTGLLAADDPAAEIPWLRALSNATAADIAVLKRDWPQAPESRRRVIAGALKALADDDFYVIYKPVFIALLDDADPSVRVAAIDGLWEATEPRLLDRYARFLAEDPDPIVRAAAAEAIGLFIERSELGELDAERVAPALALVLAAASDDDTPLATRASAVAAAGWSETPEAVEAIDAAIASREPVLEAAAMMAIGRSADTRWQAAVIAYLEASQTAVQQNAVVAAGLLGIKEAILPLARIAQDAPIAVRRAAIESLGEIGGYPATLALEMLGESESDAALLDLIDSAIESAALGEIDIQVGAPDAGGPAGAAGDEDDIIAWLSANADPEDLADWLDEPDDDDLEDDEDDVFSSGRALRPPSDLGARKPAPLLDFDEDDEDAGVDRVRPGADDEVDDETDRDSWVWDERSGDDEL
ncbi:MAG: HEAT repeat domain-containing protein [Ardenticatenales bacterium]